MTRTKAETELSKAIRDNLEKLGFMVERIQSGSVKVQRGFMRLASAGTPDLCIIGLGWLEIKRPGQKLTEDQERWHDRARRAGAWVAVAESVSDAAAIALRWRSWKERAA